MEQCFDHYSEPAHQGKASVTMSLDISSMDTTLTELLQKIEHTPGVEQARLVAVE